MAWNKNICSYIYYILVSQYYFSVKDSYKNAVLGDFSIKNEELSPVGGKYFVYSGWLGVIYDYTATNRSVAGGGGPSQGESSQLPIGHLEVISYTALHFL